MKKFPSLKVEIADLADQLAEKPELGTGIGQACFKIRPALAAKGGGKSGGSRVITHVRVTRKRVYLLSIFDKSEKDTLTDKALKALLGSIPSGSDS